MLLKVKRTKQTYSYTPFYDDMHVSFDLELADGHIRIGENYILASPDYVSPDTSRKGFLHSKLGPTKDSHPSRVPLVATLRIFDDANLDVTAPVMLREHRKNPPAESITGHGFVVGLAVLRPQINEYLPEVQFGVWLPSKSYGLLLDQVRRRNFPTSVSFFPETNDERGTVGLSYGGAEKGRMDWILETSEENPNFFFLREFSMHFQSDSSVS